MIWAVYLRPRFEKTCQPRRSILNIMTNIYIKLPVIITLISCQISSEHILSPVVVAGGVYRLVYSLAVQAVLVLLHYSYHCWLVPASPCHTCSGDTTLDQSSQHREQLTGSVCRDLDLSEGETDQWNNFSVAIHYGRSVWKGRGFQSQKSIIFCEPERVAGQDWSHYLSVVFLLFCIIIISK